MAVNTDKTLQHQLIYSVFVRNHTRRAPSVRWNVIWTD